MLSLNELHLDLRTALICAFLSEDLLFQLSIFLF